MPDIVYKTFQGTAAVASGDPEGDADHVVRRQFTRSVRAADIGAAEEWIMVAELQADISVTAFYVVSGLALAMDANNPTVTLVHGDQAAGSTTDISAALDLSAALAVRTQLAASSISSADVSKGETLYLHVETQGTPGDISEDATLTFVVEYTLQN